MRVYGIGTADELLPKWVVPIRRSKPFIVGFCHGEVGPAMADYMEPFLQDLFNLHPCAPPILADGSSRVVCVRVRCIIGDAKERSWMKGTYFEVMGMRNEEVLSIIF